MLRGPEEEIREFSSGAGTMPSALSGRGCWSVPTGSPSRRSRGEVGSKEIHTFHGTTRPEHGADVAIVVGMNGFTRPATDFAQRHGITLIGCPELKHWAHGTHLYAVLDDQQRSAGRPCPRRWKYNFPRPASSFHWLGWALGRPVRAPRPSRRRLVRGALPAAVGRQTTQRPHLVPADGCRGGSREPHLRSGPCGLQPCRYGRNSSGSLLSSCGGPGWSRRGSMSSA